MSIFDGRDGQIPPVSTPYSDILSLKCWISQTLRFCANCLSALGRCTLKEARPRILSFKKKCAFFLRSKILFFKSLKKQFQITFGASLFFLKFHFFTNLSIRRRASLKSKYIGVTRQKHVRSEISSVGIGYTLFDSGITQIVFDDFPENFDRHTSNIFKIFVFGVQPVQPEDATSATSGCNQCDQWVQPVKISVFSHQISVG